VRAPVQAFISHVPLAGFVCVRVDEFTQVVAHVESIDPSLLISLRSEEIKEKEKRDHDSFYINDFATPHTQKN
jgi:hypothetical protein